MKNDYHAKSIKEEGETIIPYSSVNRILFVPEDQYSDAFTLYLKDSQTGHFHAYSVVIHKSAWDDFSKMFFLITNFQTRSG